MRRGIMAAIAVVVLGAGGFAVAAIPQPDGTITGCYGNATGALRIVDTAGNCRNNETAISFAQKGQTGDIGPQGVQGERGPIGPTGEKGEKGDKGDKGDTGSTGAQGPKGDAGPAGKDAAAAAPPHRFEVGSARIFDSPSATQPRYSFALYGFKQGIRQPASTGGGGSGAGKVEIDHALLTKHLTPESTRLWHDLALGRHFGKAEITLERPGQVDATFTYEDVILNEVGHRGGGGEMLEKLALSAAKLTVVFASSLPAATDGDRLQIGTLAAGFDELSWGVTQPGTFSGGGSGVGRASFSTLDLQGDIGALSDELFRAVIGGRHTPEAQISLTGTIAGSPVTHTYLLEDTLVTSYEIVHEGRASGTPARQAVSLQGARITQSQTPASVHGARCFDIPAVGAC